jgi:hypothetical protein
MDPLSLSGAAQPLQGPAWRRPRRCLLKGCDRFFRPSHPLCRYCSPVCRQAARHWQCWRAQHKYRASDNGRQKRQKQAREYRRRRPRQEVPRPPPPDPPAAPSSSIGDPAPGPREGKRLAEPGQEFPLCPCDRPGCYVLFAAGTAYNPRRFCCALCRRALHRVLQREARYRRRRRNGRRSRRRRCCRSP